LSEKFQRFVHLPVDPGEHFSQPLVILTLLGCVVDHRLCLTQLPLRLRDKPLDLFALRPGQLLRSRPPHHGQGSIHSLLRCAGEPDGLIGAPIDAAQVPLICKLFSRTQFLKRSVEETVHPPQGWGGRGTLGRETGDRNDTKDNDKH